MFSEDALKLFLDLMQSGMSSEDETESSTALTPEGNMTLVDDIGEEEDKSSQQFITLVTKAGNTFYLIIDRDKDGNQNVHFLNMVDEADLLALMDEEEAAKYQEKEPEVTEPAETEKTQETEPAPEEQKTENEQKKASPLPMIMLLLFVIGAAGVGGYLYIKMRGIKLHQRKISRTRMRIITMRMKTRSSCRRMTVTRTKKWMSTRITKQNRTMNLSD